MSEAGAGRGSAAPAPIPAWHLYVPEAGVEPVPLDERTLADALAQERGVLWVDIDARHSEQHALLARVFRFHPLAIEDTLNPHSRVKLEEYPGYVFAIVRGVRYDESTEDPYDLETFNICFFLGANYLVTVRATDETACDELAPRLAQAPDRISRGAAYVMHAIMDRAVDDYFPVLERLDDFVDALEERVFVRSESEVLRDIFSVKRLVLSLRRHLLPQREVFSILSGRPTPLLSAEMQPYFRDVYDHVLRILDVLDSYRELLSSTLDSSLTQTSNRLATVTKTLSVLATLSIPFVVVSGMWGMNFAHVPLSDAPFGFWLMLGLQVAIAAGMVLVLRRLRFL